MTIDLSQVPPPDVVEEKTLAELTQDWLTNLHTEDPSIGFDSAAEGDPLYSYARTFAGQELKVRQRVNASVRGQLLSGAEGSSIDGLGALADVERLIIDPADPVTYESDDAYRGAVFRAPGAFGTGSRERYERAALAADSRISSVYAATPTPTDLDVEWLPHEGVDPGDHTAIETAISLKLEGSDESGFQYRMLTDTVAIVESSVSTQAVTAHLNVTRETDQTAAIAAATAAIEAWDVRSVRQVIARSELYRLLDLDGVLQVDLTTPATDVGPTAATAYKWGTITITAGVAPWL